MKERVFLAAIFFGLAIVVAVHLLTDTTQETHTPTITAAKTSSVSTAHPEENRMIELTNEYRKNEGLNELKVNNQLMTSSQAKADVLCESGEWSHTPNGQKFYKEIIESGYKYRNAGENLARKFDSTDKAFQALIDSPTHLENIVGDYKEIGVGFAECGGKNYYVIHYGEQL